MKAAVNEMKKKVVEILSERYGFEKDEGMNILNESVNKKLKVKKEGRDLPKSELYSIENEVTKTWERELKENGFAVVKGVWGEEEALKVKEELLKWQETYENTTPAIHGIQLHPDVAHLEVVWRVREDERIAKVFADIWKTDDLLVSFDRVNISKPNPTYKKGWLHLDQSKMKSGRWCIQGFLNCAPCGPNGGGLIVLKDSHKYFEEFCREHYDEMETGDWHKLSVPEIKWYKDRGCNSVKVCCDPGDFVLWDSRTVHHACFPTEDVIRTVVYVCMMPRALASEKDLVNKRKALEQIRATSHWAACNVKLFPREIQHYGNLSKSIEHGFKSKTTNIIDEPWFSSRCKRLAGIE